MERYPKRWGFSDASTSSSTREVLEDENAPANNPLHRGGGRLRDYPQCQYDPFSASYRPTQTAYPLPGRYPNFSEASAGQAFSRNIGPRPPSPEDNTLLGGRHPEMNHGFREFMASRYAASGPRGGLRHLPHDSPLSFESRSEDHDPISRLRRPSFGNDREPMFGARPPSPYDDRERFLFPTSSSSREQAPGGPFSGHPFVPGACDSAPPLDNSSEDGCDAREASLPSRFAGGHGVSGGPRRFPRCPRGPPWI